MIQLSLIKCNEGYKLVHVRNRCRVVWICEEYTCYLYGSFLFSGFNRFVHFMSTYANSWIKIAARQNIIWIRFSNRRAVRRRRTEAGMALTAIGEITQWGGVAGCSGSRTKGFLMISPYLHDFWPVFLLIFSPLETADFFILFMPSGEAILCCVAKNSLRSTGIQEWELFWLRFWI